MNVMEFNNTRRSNFLGHDGFIWWIGVVENRLDPLNLGRCQVRIKGLHNADVNFVSTESLPWAQPLLGTTSFTEPSTLKEGDMVMGFFMDGDQAQFPIIFGKFPGIPEDAATPGIGFSDQRKDNQLKSAPRVPESLEFKTDGTGIKITEKKTANTYPTILNEPTTDRLARNESIDKTIVKSKQDSVVDTENAVGSSWTEPKTPYNAVYPYNKVTATESGHYFELDDTPGSERVHLYHRSGTFLETHPSGTQVEKIVKDKYSIVMADDYVYIMGDCAITVQGNAKVYVKKDCDLKIDGDWNVEVGKNWNVKVAENASFDIGQNYDTTVSGSMDVGVDGSISIHSGSSVDINGSTINLN